ncbi:MAG: GyrI-like domain-containing protein [Chitinophagaceae bacterium]
MKKWLMVLLVLCGLALICSYFFIPTRINFAKVTYIKANINSGTRYIYDETKWRKWWPAAMQGGLSDSGKNEQLYSYKNYSYVIKLKMYDGMSISIEHDSNMVNSFLHIIALNRDSIFVEWKGDLPATYNPFKKISNYILATKVKRNISEVLQTAKMFLENKENVYGLQIIQEKVEDTLLISTRHTSKEYPSTATIYNLIKNLSDYIFLHGAKETNYPMLNVMQDSSVYNTMVAIPINRGIPPNENFLLKKMVPGKILVTEVKGGRYTADDGLKRLTIYMEDNLMRSPAIPFESLVTDRTKEPDTAKWITKIYYPVY